MVRIALRRTVHASAAYGPSHTSSMRNTPGFGFYSQPLRKHARVCWHSPRASLPPTRSPPAGPMAQHGWSPTHLPASYYYIRQASTTLSRQLCLRWMVAASIQYLVAGPVCGRPPAPRLIWQSLPRQRLHTTSVL